MDKTKCRLCCGNEPVYYIFTKDSDLFQKIRYCCRNLELSEDDGLPSHICVTCETELTYCYSFVLKCEDSDKKHRTNKVNNVYTDQKLDNKDLITNSKDFIALDFKTEDTKVEIKFEENSDHELYADADDLDDIALSEVLKENAESKVIDSLVKKKKFHSKRQNKERECSVCSKVCANSSALVNHMRTHSKEKKYTCTVCNISYKEPSSLHRHKARKHSKTVKSFICEHCGKEFYSKSNVQIHTRIHTGETPYACTLCPARFTQQSAYGRHMKRHTGDKSEVCTICGKKFCTKEELKNHLIVHSDEKKYTCPICNIQLKYKNNLRKHIKLHSESKSFICNYCGMSFSLKGNLKDHIKRKHSEKSGYCNTCLKNVSNIEVHMWKHTGERPLKCELCTCSFYELKALARHINFRHKKTDKHKCTFEGCSSSFPIKPMLDFHVAKIHKTGIPFPCDKCARGFYRKNDLARHKIGTHKERLT